VRRSPCEPTPADALSNRIIQALMTADGINAERLETLMREMAGKLANDRVLTRSPA
jgi:hypothetical protein